MARNRSVMRIFVLSSGIMKMALILPIPGSSWQRQGEGQTRRQEERRFRSPCLLVSLSPCLSSGLRLPWLHLVLDRLLGRRDDLHRAALGRDLLGGRLGEVAGPDGELLGQLALAEDADAVGGA